MEPRIRALTETEFTGTSLLHVRDLQRLAEPPRNHLRFAPDQTGRGVWIAGVVGIAGFVLAYFTHVSNIPVSTGLSSQSLEGL